MKTLESLAHFWLLGFLPGLLFGEGALPLYYIREFTDWNFPWPFKGQWPPGDVISLLGEELGDSSFDRAVFAPLDRVRDMTNDVTETVAGWALGNLVQKGLILYYLRR